MNELRFNNSPSDVELAEAWLKFGVKMGHKSSSDFIEYFRSPHVAWHPIVFWEGSYVVGLLWFTNHDKENGMIQAHFNVGGIDNYKAGLSLASAVLRTIVREAKINVVLAVFPVGNRRARFMSRIFGFKMFAKNSKLCYTAISLNGE